MAPPEDSLVFWQKPFQHIELIKFSRGSRFDQDIAKEWGKITSLVVGLEKYGSKVSSLRWSRKRLKFLGIPCLFLENAEKNASLANEENIGNNHF